VLIRRVRQNCGSDQIKTFYSCSFIEFNFLVLNKTRKETLSKYVLRAVFPFLKTTKPITKNFIRKRPSLQGLLPGEDIVIRSGSQCQRVTN